jgi:hypothetical protein
MAAVAAAAAAGGEPSASAATAAGSRVSGASSGGGSSTVQRSRGVPALPTLRTLHSYNSGNPDRPSSSGPFSSGAKASPFMAYDVSVLLCAASTASGAQVVRAVSDMTSSSVADSSLQIPQWASPLNSASISGTAGTAGPPGSSCSDASSELHVGAAVGQHSDSSACLQQQQQQQQEGGVVQVGYTRSGGGSKGGVRTTPFMKPCNVPPGLE